MKVLCRNPCFIGSCFSTYKITKKANEEKRVVILVLLEVVFQLQ